MENFRETFRPVMELIAKPFTGIHPNILSVLLFVVAIPGFYFYSIGNSLLGSLFIFAAMFDAVDGTVARLTKTESKFGGLLDSTLDRLFDGLLLLFIGIGNLVPWVWLFLLFNLSVLVSYIKAKAEALTGTQKVGKNNFSVGFAQRADRIIVIFLGSILNGLITPENNEILIITVMILSILAAITVIWRGFVIYKVLKDNK